MIRAALQMSLQAKYVKCSTPKTKLVSGMTHHDDDGRVRHASLVGKLPRAQIIALALAATIIVKIALPYRDLYATNKKYACVRAL